MTYRNALREGFNLINRNWQLVAIQVTATLVNCAFFFLIVALPIIGAVILLGSDLTDLPDIWTLSVHFGDYLTKYLGLLLSGLILFLIYMLLVSFVTIFLYGASSGVIAHGVKKTTDRFSTKLFVSEGKRLFYPIVKFLTAAGLLLLAIALIIVLMLASAVSTSEYLKQMHDSLGLLAGMFFMILAISLSLFLITSSFSLIFYGTAALLFKGEGTFATLKKAARFLYENPSAYWFYCILLGFSFVLAFFLMTISIPFKMIPVIGSMLSIPYQILSYTVQSYFGFFVISVIFFYFYNTVDLNGVYSNEGNDTSTGESAGQDSTPLP